MGSFGRNLGALGKIPGMQGLHKLGGLRKLASQMSSGGGIPGLPNMFGGAEGSGTGGAKKLVDRDKLKKLRKAAKQSKKKNRKK